MLAALIVLYILIQCSLLTLAHRRERAIPFARALIILSLAAAAAWMIFINDSAQVLTVAPFKYAVILFNLVPLLLTIAVALLNASRPKQLSRTLVFFGLMLSVNFYFWSGAFYQPVKSLDRWQGVCCLQSTDYSCGAAAAATLLKVNGIDAHEAELVKTCMTGFRGTSFWGLYHGLRDASDARGKRVTVSTESATDLINRGRPALVYLMLTPELDARDKRYAQEWHWEINVAHAVVFLGKDGDESQVYIADPSFGIERWNVEALQQLWRNRAVSLE
ncbi:MAG TPA: C39 family peptidase [Planctomycetota bacterium]|nr:C39 family peptidase [Planctomycetota bacterium]